MNGIRYKVTVGDGVHKHMDQLIEEIWIPELNVCFNEKGGCFYCDQPRGDGNEIEISESDALLFKNFIMLKDSVDAMIKNYF